MEASCPVRRGEMVVPFLRTSVSTLLRTILQQLHLPGRGGGKPGGGPKPIGPVWDSIGFAWPLSA